jgi:hypothetical protein
MKARLKRIEKEFQRVYSSDFYTCKQDFINEITELRNEGLNDTQIHRHYNGSVSLFDIQDVFNGTFSGEHRNY